MTHTQPTPTAEAFIDFQADPSIISDFIYRQNGTLSSAMGELITNFIDAKSPGGALIITITGFEVLDTGHGFDSRETIERCFRRFGTLHAEGDAKYGRFRVGRGQCMGLGKVCWHSNQYKMNTDVKQFGNGFFLTEDSNDIYPGCKVTCEFYEPLNDEQLNAAIEEIKKKIRFMLEPITVNGVLASQVGAQVAWDYEDNYVCIKWEPARETGIYLYSQGVFVKQLYQYGYGFSADIVTKSALMLNIARNEINENDVLWLKIAKVLRERSVEVAKNAAKSSRMDEHVRLSAIDNLLKGHIRLPEAMEMNLFRDYRKRLISVKQIIRSSIPVTAAKVSGCLMADSMSSQRIAFVLHHHELKIWRSSSMNELQFLLDHLIERDLSGDASKHAILQLNSVSFVEFGELSSRIDSRKDLLKSADLTARQRAGLYALSYVSRVMAKSLTGLAKVKARKVIPGSSDSALAWTDGKLYIAFDINFMAELDEGVSGFVRLCSAMLHEYCHTESDQKTNEHDFEFYQNFHDSATITTLLGACVKSLFHQYCRQLIECNERLPSSIESLYTDPISRELKVYTGRLGKNGLSPLAILLLESTSARFTAGTRIFECTVNQLSLAKGIESRWSITPALQRSLETSLANVAKKDRYEMPNIEDYKELGKDLYRKHLYEALARWAADKGHDPHVITSIPCVFEKLRNSIDYKKTAEFGGFEAVLQLICLDKNSDLIAFSFQTVVPLEVKGSAYGIASYTNLAKPLSGRFGEAYTAEKVANSRDLRFKSALFAIKKIVDGITDPVEQTQFIEQHLKEGVFDDLENHQKETTLLFD